VDSTQQVLYVDGMDNEQVVIGYARVSTDEQGSSGVGLATQRQAIEIECGHRGWTLLRVEEEVLSGKNMRRPRLQAVLAACRAGEADGFVVSKLDRLSRSLIDFARLLDEAKRHGFNVVALDLGVDLSTPSGEFLANVMASAAQWERRIIGERTKSALAVKRAQGVRLGRPPTLAGALAERIVVERAQGRTLAAIAEDLNRESVPTAHGGARWHPATVRSVLVRLSAAA
jgi:DNA invertase Pin-like site-specific DNA recombinase